MVPDRRPKTHLHPRPVDLLVDRRPVRLNRYLAAAGIASRRAVEELITAGRVTINGVTVERHGAHVLPGRDRVTLDGELVESAVAPSYVLLFKPPGVLTTVSDPHGRRTIMDLLGSAERGQRLFPVGRLDLDSEGLVLLTNDGTLAHRLMHPRYHVAKRYQVRTDPRPTSAALKALARGIQIAPRTTTRPARVEPCGSDGFEIVLQEGKKRQIRLMCEALGLRVLRLVRVAFGPLTVGRLRPGQHRRLGADEVQALWIAAGLDYRLADGASAGKPQHAEAGGPHPEPDETPDETPGETSGAD